MSYDDLPGRIADAPARMLYARLRDSEGQIRRATEFAQQMRDALILKTGHGPAPAKIHPDIPRGITCICGWYEQGGYTSDKQRAVGHHVLTEWEKAAEQE